MFVPTQACVAGLGVLISYRRFLVGWLFSCTWLYEEFTFCSLPCTGPWVSSPLLFHPDITALTLRWISGCGFKVNHRASTSSLLWISRCLQHKSPLMPGLFLRLPSSGSWTNNYSLPCQLPEFFEQVIFILCLDSQSSLDMTPCSLTSAATLPFLSVLH